MEDYVIACLDGMFALKKHRERERRYFCIKLNNQDL